MPYQKYPQFHSNGLRSQPNGRLSARSQGEVLQDKARKKTARLEAEEPASVAKPMRAHPSITSVPRSQSTPTRKRQLVQLTLWVKPIVKSRLQRKADEEGVSVSTAGHALIEKALQQDADMGYGALLTPVIESAIKRAMAKRDARLAYLLVRILLATEEGRILATNILSRLPGVTAQMLEEILKSAAQKARAKITHTTPQIEDILTELEEMLSEQEKGGGERQK